MHAKSRCEVRRFNAFAERNEQVVVGALGCDSDTRLMLMLLSDVVTSSEAKLLNSVRKTVDHLHLRMYSLPRHHGHVSVCVGA